MVLVYPNNQKEYPIRKTIENSEYWLEGIYYDKEFATSKYRQILESDPETELKLLTRSRKFRPGEDGETTQDPVVECLLYRRYLPGLPARPGRLSSIRERITRYIPSRSFKLRLPSPWKRPASHIEE